MVCMGRFSFPYRCVAVKGALHHAVLVVGAHDRRG